MNIVELVAVAAGALVGIGVALVVAGSVRAHPVLADALAALDERTAHHFTPDPDPAWSTGRRLRRGLLAVVRRLPLVVPDRDLRLLGWSRDRYLLGRIGAAAAYAAAGPVLAVTLLVVDAALPVVVPAGFSLLGGLVGWSGYARRVRDRAEDARDQLRHALVAYLTQVSLLRRGGAGVATALAVPARLLDDSWAMRRIADQLELAERGGLMPWEGLRRFGTEIDLDELTDLSTIAATAGHDGGAVIDTLLARADSLNDELLADAHAAANRATGQMSTPGALQVFLIAAWVLYPAATALLAT